MDRALFLDRDDTLTLCDSVTAHTAFPGDLVDPGLVQLLPGVADACRRAHEAGFRLVVFSNQGGVARGAGTLEDVHAVNNRVNELLVAAAGESARIEAFYFCPYHPKGNIPAFTTEHPWRKPAGGMLLAAAKDLGLDLAKSWAIGDKQRDVDAAVAAGIDPRRALLIFRPPARRPDLAGAVDYMLSAENAAS